MSSLLYCIRQGFANIRRNLLFSMASMATVSACVFLFCLFYVLSMNIREVTLKAESSIGISVFFEESAGEAEKEEIRSRIQATGLVRDIRYISAEEAWSNFQKQYFGEDEAGIAAAFEGDNPLSDSDSFEVFSRELEDQPVLAGIIAELPGVRRVSYANSLISALKRLNQGVRILALAITAVLLLISVFLIRNTISVAAEVRRRETEIMKLIGASPFMIRAPFVVEGMVIGTLGAAISVGLTALIYTYIGNSLRERMALMMDPGILGEIFRLLPLKTLMPGMLLAGLVLGTLMGLVVSFLTIRRHLKL